MQASSSTTSSEKPRGEAILTEESPDSAPGKTRDGRRLLQRRGLRIFVTLIAVFLCLAFLQELLIPKYMGKIVEGAMVAEYYQEKMDHEVILVGDCELYENFDPVYLWKNYGINSYIRGSAQQLIWQSYYLLEETLDYEHPEVVIFNVLSLQYDKPQKESYNRMTLDGMRWSKWKALDIQASMLPEEKFIDYVFPLLRYHSRWQELSEEDFRYLFHRDKVTHNGYYLRTDVRPAENVPEGKPLADYSFGENAWAYLDKIRELCEREHITLLLVKAPSLYPYWYPEWEEQVEEYAARYHLEYINYLELIEETGLDFSKDTYDAGLHLNLSGADKITDHLGRLLREGSPEYGRAPLPDRRGEEELSRRWEVKIRDYEEEIAEQALQGEGAD